MLHPTSIRAITRILFPVQFRGKAAGSEGELDEAAAGRHHDEDGCARQGIHAEQAAGRDSMRLYRVRLKVLS